MGTHFDRLCRLDSCAVSDALDRVGRDGALLGISPMTTTGRRLAGRISTVRVVARSDDEPRPHLGTTAIEAGGPGTVLVVSSGGRTDVSGWGGILSLAAIQRGIEGVVVDGACRDVDEARELGFPVFARASVPVTARGRIVEQATDVRLDVNGVEVLPGDWLVADGSGVVRCPGDAIDEVLDVAERLTRRETAMADAVRAGRPVSEVMHDREFDVD